MSEASPQPASESPKSPPATKLWQWVLVSSGIGTSLAAGAPRLWEEWKALRLGIARSELSLAQEQERIWSRNADCLQQAGSYEIDGPHGIVIRVTLCQGSGDTLIRYHLNSWPAVYRWVALPVEKVKR